MWKKDNGREFVFIEFLNNIMRSHWKNITGVSFGESNIKPHENTA
jgi:hypothetical protein